MSKATELSQLMEAASELTIVCHNNPDPDCLASALALGHIAAGRGIDEQRILYSGTITHQQNRAFVNLLDMELVPFEESLIRDRGEASLLAFVDHSISGSNNAVPADILPDIVIDHHPAEDVAGTFVDHREEIGATATILTEYLDELGVAISPKLATALLFAIRRETLGFLRGVTTNEYLAAAYLHESADRELLRRLTMPAVSGATINAIADAINNRVVRGSVLITHVGTTSERDALPQAADYLATLEGVGTAVVFGIVGSNIELSARSTDRRVHLGNALKEAFDDVGSAGGHRNFAGGEVPLGIVADYSAETDGLIDIVERVVTRRVLESLNITVAEEEDIAQSSREE